MKYSSLPDTYKLQDCLYDTRSRLNGWEKRLAQQDGLSARWQWVVFSLVVIALFSRNPSLLAHAQFYAEDGSIWFAQAYNLGWLHSLVVTQAGYLNTMPRLAAGLALLVPIGYAPFVMATVGLLVQSLPVTILLSSRCRAWAPLPTRMVLAAIYVAIPNSREIHVVATNSMWHLAVSAVLIAFASSPRTWRGRVFDSVLLLEASISGPFCIVLVPLILIFWWRRRQPWSLVISAVTGIGAFTQMLLILFDTNRVPRPLGATLGKFFRVLGGNVFAGSLIGGHSFSTTPAVFILLATLVGVSICLYCLRFANIEWTLFLVYCAGVYAASLHNPVGVPDPSTGTVESAWDMLLENPSGRYSFLPMLMFLWSAIWCALYGRDRLFRLAGASIFLTMSIGIVRDWKYADYPNKHFPESVRRLRDAKQGDHVIVPIPPEGWQMELVKKGSSEPAKGAS